MTLADKINGRIRMATLDDAKDVRDIYAPFVEDSTISFETRTPTESEMAIRIADTMVKYPWLVFERDRKVIGYAYASQHRAREAYRWSTDVAVYVHQDFSRQGIGRELYKILLGQLEQSGFANALAGISLPNQASVALHESFGFTPIGVYRNVGYKLGAWHNVGWWQKSFSHPKNPVEPVWREPYFD